MLSHIVHAHRTSWNISPELISKITLSVLKNILFLDYSIHWVTRLIPKLLIPFKLHYHYRKEIVCFMTSRSPNTSNEALQSNTKTQLYCKSGIADMSNHKNHEPLFMYKRVRQNYHAGRLIKELIKKVSFLNHIVIFVAHLIHNTKGMLRGETVHWSLVGLVPYVSFSYLLKK